MGIGIAVEELSKSFGGRRVLDGVSCRFEAGRISAVIGPNGSGKTTLLRILARLETPDGGAVRYLNEGRELAGKDGLMRRLTLVGQRPTLFNMSVYDNVAYGLRARGLPPETVGSRVVEALDAAGLSGLARARAGTLSGGEAQRAVLARAYALMPELLLADEPTANLDPENTALAEKLIRKMSGERGSSTVMVTHNLFQARRLADRIYFVMDGRLVEEAGTADFFSAPSEPLSRSYISGELIC